MNKEAELKKLTKVTRRIAREYKPEKIILFGSYAWGRPTRDSDFDLCIIKKVGETKKDFFAEHKKVHDIINGEIAVDILVYSPAKIRRRLDLGDFFVEDIVTKGRIIYEKKHAYK
ncbi:nucleotidyltransferase domain-containing protein [Candidatus Uhrbacteria bacterium]|nr:nucleotidyltransferase domain-containing protein [Candidatus Uhrbacteria bacterium]